MNGRTRLAEALATRLRQGTPANVALMLLLMEAPSADDAAAAVALVPVADPAVEKAAAEIERLRLAHPDAWQVVHAVADSVDHVPPSGSANETLDHWRRAFDRLADRSPEAGVALYALGDPLLLDAATAEVVGALQDWGLLGATRDVFDLGCGIGRFAAGLAPKVRTVLGVDLSDRMLVEAERRNRQPNVRFLLGSGRDLGGVETQGFDLVLASDVFPYLVGAGLADRHIAEIHRVLRPGGTAVILNYSYRGDPDRDRTDLGISAEAHGFEVVRPGRGRAVRNSGPEDGIAAFRFWDAAVFQLVKPG